jgi:hypothetical protein
MNTDEYQQQFKVFFDAANRQNAGVPGRPLDATQVDQLSALHQGLDLIDDIGAKAQKVFEKAKPAISGVKVTLPVEQTDEYKNFDTTRQLAISLLAKGVGGQVGVLTDNDIKVMKDALPNEHDTPDQIAAKVANLKQQSLIMLKDKLRYYQAAHYDTGNLPTLYGEAQNAFNRQQQHQTTNPQQLSPAQAAIEHQTRMDKVRAQSRPIPAPPPPSGTPSSPPLQPIGAYAPPPGIEAQPSVGVKTLVDLPGQLKRALTPKPGGPTDTSWYGY